MLILLSPSKTLDFDSPVRGSYTQPDFLEQSNQLIRELRKLDARDIQKLMSLSPKLAALNVERYRHFSTPFTPENARQAIYAFKGNVYDGLEAQVYTQEEIKRAHKHLRILSGLYGLLRPLDLIQPYRLEMGTNFKNANGKNLYDFWGQTITNKVKEALSGQGDNTVINLASEEYSKAVNFLALGAQTITPVFKDYHKGEYKMLMLYVKKARGLMTSYILRQNLTDAESIKNFDVGGYHYNEKLSHENEWVFTRG